MIFQLHAAFDVREFRASPCCERRILTTGILFFRQRKNVSISHLNFNESMLFYKQEIPL